MTRVQPQATPIDSEGDPKASTPERAPNETNYGYETDHPSYKLRKAGAWTPQQTVNKDYRPVKRPPVAPIDEAQEDPTKPKNPGRHRQR